MTGLIRLFIFSCIVFISSVTAQPRFDDSLYRQLMQITHLNNVENQEKLNKILTTIESISYAHKRAPYYAYSAKLISNHGDWQRGKPLLEKAITALNKLENSHLIIDTLDYISWIYFNRGDYTNAIYYVQKMADYGYEADNIRAQSIALKRLAFSYLELEYNELAIEPLNKSLELARQSGNTDTEFLALLYLINAHIDFNNVDPQDTMRLIEQAQSIKTRLNESDGYLPRLKGIVFQQLGDFEQAKTYLHKSLAVAIKDNDLRLNRMINRDLASFYLAVDAPHLALEHANKSADIAKKLEHHASIAALHYVYSKIYTALGDNKEALHCLNLYTEFLTSGGNKNAIGLLTMMDKKLDSMQQQQKVIELENSVLETQLAAQKSYNDQNLTIISILIIAFAFVGLTTFYFIRNRMLSMRVALSMKDALTGAYGRNYLKHYLPRVMANVERRGENTNESFGVMLIDCDDFKLVNEQYGHGGGDITLKRIVETINQQIRCHDALFRWGGDEFVLMCESVSKHQLKDISQRLTQAIDALIIKYEDKTISPTVSIGFALHQTTDAFDLDELLKTADDYLYQSKRAGKNSARGN